MSSISVFGALPSDAPCATSIAWVSALVGGLTVRDDDLAPTMVLFFILLIFLAIGILRAHAGRNLLDILLVFIPTLLFVASLTVYSAIRAHLSNLSYSSSSSVTFSQSSLYEHVAANGLVSCSPMLLCETTFQVFGLLAKRIAEAGRGWVMCTAYAVRAINMVSLVMGVVAACDFASYLTAWLDQKKLAVAPSEQGTEVCNTNALGRDLTLVPLMAAGLELVLLFVLIVLTLVLRLRYRLAQDVALHVIAILSCLALHFAWKCARDWSAVQGYVDGEWSKAVPVKEDLEDLAKQWRKGAEHPTMFYLLGMMPLVLAMILIYTLDLVSYTNPPPRPALACNDLTSRFHLVLDPSSPQIELLPTSKGLAQAKDGSDRKKNAKAGNAAKTANGSDAAKTAGETYVMKRGWFGGWSVQPAQRGDGWMKKVKSRARQKVQTWVLGWSAETTSAV